jgi:LuxR family maltose regulon positive regulatory protein
MMPEYIAKVLAAFEATPPQGTMKLAHIPTPALTVPPLNLTQPLIEPLSKRELEVLQLITEGLSNQEISERLFLALSSVKGHNRNIFDKLQVQRRTEAVARARELGLIPL